MRDLFEELIQTIERWAEDNTATITDVKLFARSWRKERDAEQFAWFTRSDGDNDYLLPPWLVKDFEKDNEQLSGLLYLDDPDKFDYFNDKYEKYRI